MHLIFLFIGMAIVKLFYGNRKEKKENFLDNGNNILQSNLSKIKTPYKKNLFV